MRHGCSLSLLLFAITIESFALRSRQSEEYKGIEMGDSTEQIALYANDIILYMQDTQDTLRKAMSIIDKKINYIVKDNITQSKLIPNMSRFKNCVCLWNGDKLLPFKISIGDV